jgi:hypothetical protein
MADTAGRSAVGKARFVPKLGRYRSITACALVWMLCDIRDLHRRIIDYTIRLNVRYAYFHTVPGRYRADSTAQRCSRCVVGAHPRICILTATQCKFLNTRAVGSDTVGSRGRSRDRLVANAPNARLPVRRICLLSRIRGFRETPQAR